MTHTGWRNVISLSAVLNFLLPARGRWAPVLRTISSEQSSSSWCRTCLCFHQHIFTCRRFWKHPRCRTCCPPLSRGEDSSFFIVQSNTFIYWYIFFFSEMTSRLSSTLPASKSSQPRPPGAHWLKAQEEEEPVSPKEWTSEYKYYSDYILLLLVQPHNRAPEMQIMSSGFQRQY